MPFLPAKLLGLAFILAGLLFYRGVRLARVRGYTGPKHRRIHRDTQTWRFQFALGSQAVGALICFVGAYLCLTGAFIHDF